MEGADNKLPLQCRELARQQSVKHKSGVDSTFVSVNVTPAVANKQQYISIAKISVKMLKIFSCSQVATRNFVSLVPARLPVNSFTPDLDPRFSWLATNISLWTCRDQWKSFVRSWPNSHHASFWWSILVAAMASFTLVLLAPCQNTRRSLQGLVAQGHFSFRDEVISCFLNFRHEEGCLGWPQRVVRLSPCQRHPRGLCPAPLL